MRLSRRAFTPAQVTEAKEILGEVFQRIWAGEPGLEAYHLVAGHLATPVYRVRRFGPDQLAIHEVTTWGGQGGGIYLSKSEGIPDYIANIHLRHSWDGQQMIPLEYRAIAEIQPAFGRLTVTHGSAESLMNADPFGGSDRYDSQNIPEAK